MGVARLGVYSEGVGGAVVAVRARPLAVRDELRELWMLGDEGRSRSFAPLRGPLAPTHHVLGLDSVLTHAERMRGREPPSVSRQ